LFCFELLTNFSEILLGRNILNWHPIHPSHAIERTRISVQFVHSLPQKTVQKLSDTFEADKANFGFGLKTEIEAITFAPVTPMPMQTNSRGWQYMVETQPGIVLESLILMPDSLIYENSEYVGWEGFWDRASQLLLPLVSQISSVVDLRLFALEYFDRFIFNGNPINASPVELINEEIAATLSQSARDGEALWHIHRGWFDSTDGIRVLINQNIDAVDGNNASGEKIRSLSVYTKVERRNENEIVVPDFINDEMIKLHAISKALFKKALGGKAQKLLGLNDAS
jgi:uncharacterized protein (TIGR04255 family)